MPSIGQGLPWCLNVLTRCLGPQRLHWKAPCAGSQVCSDEQDTAPPSQHPAFGGETVGQGLEQRELGGWHPLDPEDMVDN